MKKYRLAYENLFLPNDDSGINYNDENITNISIYMLFKIIDKSTGNEVYFHDEDLVNQKLEYVSGEYCYVNNYYKCVVDEKETYKMIPDEELLKKSDYSVLYEIGDCIKWVGSDPIVINHDEFVDILKNNFAKFNNSNNKPTQSTSYYIVEVGQ